MTDKITVASTAHLSIRAGDNIILGSNSFSAVNGVGITRNVDAKSFNAWLALQEEEGKPLFHLMKVVTDKEVDDLSDPEAPPLFPVEEPKAKAEAETETEAEKPATE